MSVLYSPRSGPALSITFPPPRPLRLDDDRRDAFLWEALRVGGGSGLPDNALLIDQSRALARYLQPLSAFVEDLTHPEGADFVLFSNLPLDLQLPAPPEDGRRPAVKATWVSELTLLAVALVGGLEPLTYQQLRGNALVHEIAPALAQAQTGSSLGRTSFGFHTDAAILQRPYRPEVLLLLGLVNAGQTPTLVAPLESALAWLRQEVPTALAVLQSPRYRIRNPQLMTIGQGKIIYSEPRPVLTLNPAQGWEIAGDFPTLQALDAEAKAALTALQQAFDHSAIPIVLEPGMLLMFNNHRVAHGRSPISGARWLQRLYARQSLSALHQATGQEHVFDVHRLILE